MNRGDRATASRHALAAQCDAGRAEHRAACDVGEPARPLVPRELGSGPLPDQRTVDTGGRWPASRAERGAALPGRAGWSSAAIARASSVPSSGRQRVHGLSPRRAQRAASAAGLAGRTTASRRHRPQARQRDRAMTALAHPEHAGFEPALRRRRSRPARAAHDPRACARRSADDAGRRPLAEVAPAAGRRASPALRRSWRPSGPGPKAHLGQALLELRRQVWPLHACPRRHGHQLLSPGHPCGARNTATTVHNARDDSGATRVTRREELRTMTTRTGRNGQA